MNKKNKTVKRFIYIAALFFIVLFSVGYSALSSTLNIGGNTRYNIKKPVRVSNIQLSGVTGEGVEYYNPDFRWDWVFVGVEVPDTNSTVTYSIIITNYTLKDYSVSFTRNADTNPNINGVISGNPEYIPGGGSATLTLTFTRSGGSNSIDEEGWVFTFTEYDQTSPTIVSVSGNPTSWAPYATLTINANDNGVGLHATPYSFDDGATWQASNQKSYTTNQTVSIKVRDAYENVTSQSVSITKVDSVTPTVTVSAKKASAGTTVSSGSWSSEGLNFTLTAGTTGSSGYTIKYCYNTSNSCTPSTEATSGTAITTYNTNTGTYYIRYRITSGAGINSSISTYTAKVDTVTPTVTISAKKASAGTTVSSGSWSTEGLNFTLTKGTTGSSGYTIKYCYNTSNSCTPSTETTSGTAITTYNTNTGTYYIRYRITSGAGINSSISTYTAKVDNTKPTITSVTGNPTSVAESATLTVNAADTISGLHATAYSFDNGSTWQASNQKTFTSNQTVNVKVRDAATNVSNATQVVINKVYPSYTATWSNGSHCTIAVSRTSSPRGASTGTLSSGATIYREDVLSITYTAATGYTIKTKGSTSITVTGNVTSSNIYCTTEATTYTITYNVNGGNSISNGSYTIETATFSLPIPTKSGNLFGGWYANSGFTGSPVTQITKGTTGNKTFYAKWVTSGYQGYTLIKNYSGSSDDGSCNGNTPSGYTKLKCFYVGGSSYEAYSCMFYKATRISPTTAEVHVYTRQYKNDSGYYNGYLGLANTISLNSTSMTPTDTTCQTSQAGIVSYSGPNGTYGQAFVNSIRYRNLSLDYKFHVGVTSSATSVTMVIGQKYCGLTSYCNSYDGSYTVTIS